MKCFLFHIFFALCFLPGSWASSILPNELERVPTYSLNGDWWIACVKAESPVLPSVYVELDTPISNWMHANIPGNAPLPYMEGLRFQDTGYIQYYRRHFPLPDSWKGRRILLRIDGVLSEYRVWVDGSEAGKIEDPLGTNQFDITDSLKYNERDDHTIGIQVLPSPHQNNNCLFRDIALLALPEPYIDALQLTTELDEAAATAKLHVVASLQGIQAVTDWSRASLSLELFAPQGGSAAQITISWFESQNGRAVGRAILPVSQPSLWTAETPSLYRLAAELSVDGRPVYRTTQPVGLRRFRTDRGILTLNGAPIELRGIVYSQSHPDVGYALQESHWLADLQHMKNGNINALRIVDRPPHPRFLQLCDEWGFYVLYDLPIGQTGNDVSSRIQNLIVRDGNHPCILAWNLSGCASWDDEVNQLAQLVKSLNSNSLLMASGLSDPSLPAVVDLLAPEYPDLEELRRFANSKRPTIVSAHTSAIGNSLEGLEDIQKAVRENASIAGGMLQQFADDPFPEGNGREDGILNAGRTPQIDFWQTRRVYSPVQILEDERPVKPGKQSVELTLSNRYDFTNLRDLIAQWFLLRDGQPVLNRTFVVNLEPHRDMELSTVLDIPGDLADCDYTLQYQFSEPSSGRVIYERVVRLRQDDWQKDFLSRMRDLKWDKQWRVTGEPLRAEISHRTYSFIVQLATPGWFLRTQDHNIRLITDGPFLYFGRHQPESVSLPIREASAWIVKDLWIDAKTMEKQGNAVEIRTHCRETASPSHGESAQAQIDILSSAFGYTDIRFSIQPGDRQSMQQAGLAFRVPPTLNSIAWLGDGPSSSYPGQSALNSWGFYLFPITAIQPGNRSRVQLLSLCDKNGYGLGIVLLDGNVSVEPGEDGTWIVVNAALAGLGNGVSPTRYPVNEDRLPGNETTAFRLIPLIRGNYPSIFSTLWKTR